AASEASFRRSGKSVTYGPFGASGRTERYCPAILISVLFQQFQPLTLSRAHAPFSHPDWIFEIKWDGRKAGNVSYTATTSTATAKDCSGSPASIIWKES